MPPKGSHATQGYTFDALELGTPKMGIRHWEIRSKAGGALMGEVCWEPARRAYIFVPGRLPVVFTDLDLAALSRFVEVRTATQLQYKREAAG
jgi:hypothetical protein